MSVSVVVLERECECLWERVCKDVSMGVWVREWESERVVVGVWERQFHVRSWWFHFLLWFQMNDEKVDCSPPIKKLLHFLPSRRFSAFDFCRMIIFTKNNNAAIVLIQRCYNFEPVVKKHRWWIERWGRENQKTGTIWINWCLRWDLCTRISNKPIACYLRLKYL